MDCYSSSDTLGGDLGLAISSAMTISTLAFWGFLQTTEMENQLTSVERLLEYCDLEPEAPWEVQGDGVEYSVIYNDIFLLNIGAISL